jgi:hypothetical protein
VQARFGLEQNPELLLMVFVGRWCHQKGIDLIADVAEWLLTTVRLSWLKLTTQMPPTRVTRPDDMETNPAHTYATSARPGGAGIPSFPLCPAPRTARVPFPLSAFLVPQPLSELPLPRSLSLCVCAAGGAAQVSDGRGGAHCRQPRHVRAQQAQAPAGKLGGVRRGASGCAWRGCPRASPSPPPPTCRSTPRAASPPPWPCSPPCSIRCEN